MVVLIYINAYGNQLSSIDLSQNTSLNYLDVSHNQLSSLDISHNTALTQLFASENDIPMIDLSNNQLLYALSIDDVPIKASLTYLIDGDNYVFDMSNLAFLRWIDETENYTYDRSTSTLTVSNLNGTKGYATIATMIYPIPDQAVTYTKFILSDYVLTLSSDDSDEILDTLVCLPANSNESSCQVTLPSTGPTKQGYKFLGWTSSIGSSEQYIKEGESFELTDRTTLYSAWKEDKEEDEENKDDENEQKDNKEDKSEKEVVPVPDTGSATNGGGTASATIFVVPAILLATMIGVYLHHHKKSASN